MVFKENVVQNLTGVFSGLTVVVSTWPGDISKSFQNPTPHSFPGDLSVAVRNGLQIL